MGARYHDTLERRSGAWRIAERTVILDWNKTELWPNADTDTATNGTEWVLQGNPLKVVDVRKDLGKTVIPRDGVVLSYGGLDLPPRLDWLAPGMHVTSVGYAPPGGELDPRVIEQGRLFVETRLAFEPPPAGCAELAGLDPSVGTELGEVLLGRSPGRQSKDELTVYKAMGHVCEDLAAASLVYHRAKQEGAGRTVQF